MAHVQPIFLSNDNWTENNGWLCPELNALGVKIVYIKIRGQEKDIDIVRFRSDISTLIWRGDFHHPDEIEIGVEYDSVYEPSKRLRTYSLIIGIVTSLIICALAIFQYSNTHTFNLYFGESKYEGNTVRKDEELYIGQGLTMTSRNACYKTYNDKTPIIYAARQETWDSCNKTWGWHRCFVSPALILSKA